MKYFGITINLSWDSKDYTKQIKAKTSDICKDTNAIGSKSQVD